MALVRTPGRHQALNGIPLGPWGEAWSAKLLQDRQPHINWIPQGNARLTCCKKYKNCDLKYPTRSLQASPCDQKPAIAHLGPLHFFVEGVNHCKLEVNILDDLLFEILIQLRAVEANE